MRIADDNEDLKQQIDLDILKQTPRYDDNDFWFYLTMNLKRRKQPE